MILFVWCIPSLVLVASVTWHRYKAQLRIRQLHLDVLFQHRQHA